MRVDLLSPPIVNASPREILTTGIRVTNSSITNGTYGFSVVLPAGWFYFTAPETLDLGAGKSEDVFISITIPADTLAGIYPLKLGAFREDDPSDKANVDIRVSIISVTRLEVTAGKTAGFDITSGESIIQPFTITNHGNSQCRIAIRIETHPERVITTDIPDSEFILDPGMWRTVNVRVEIPRNLSQPMTQTITLIARTVDLQGQATEVRTGTSTKIVPKQLAGSAYPIMEGDMSLISSFQDDGESTYAISIGPLHSDLGDGQTIDAELRNLLLHGDTTGTFIQRERFILSYTDEDRGYFRVGDLPFNLGSPLVQKYIAGRGGDAMISSGSDDIRLFYSRAGGSANTENTGLQFITRFEDDGIVRLTALQSNEINIPGSLPGEKDESTNFGIMAGFSPIEFAHFTGELSKSRSKLDGTETGWRITGGLDLDRFTANCEWLHADNGFHGGWSDTEIQRVNLRWSPLDELSLWANYNLSQNNLDNIPDIEGRLLRNVGFGLLWDIDNVGRFRMSWRAIHDWDDVLLSHDDVSRTSVYSLSRGWGDFYATAAYERQIDNHRIAVNFEELNSLRLDLAMRIDPDAYLRFSLAQGNISQNTDPGNRDVTDITIGSQWRVTDDFRTSLSIRRNSDGFDGTRTDINGIAMWELDNDRNINFRIRNYNDPYDSNTELSVEYQMPLSFELGMFPNRGSVKGRLFFNDDPSTGIQNARISVDGVEVLTGEHGEFEFPSLDPGLHELTIDPASLGVDIIPLIDLPAVFSVEAGGTTDLEIPATRSASIEGCVITKIPPGHGHEGSEWPMAEAVVELRSETEILTRTTDINGRFTFTGLKPGRYMLFLREEFLPEGYAVLPPISYDLELGSGGAISDLDFQVGPEDQEIIITTNLPTIWWSM